MRVALLAALALAGATPALAHAADSGDSYSVASQQSAEAASTLAQAGVKTVAGVVAVPLMVVAGGSVVAGSASQGAADSAGASAEGFSQAGADAAGFATMPLIVTETVVMRPQAAPQVPYEAQTPK